MGGVTPDPSVPFPKLLVKSTDEVATAEATDVDLSFAAVPAENSGLTHKVNQRLGTTETWGSMVHADDKLYFTDQKGQRWTSRRGQSTKCSH